MCVPIEGHTREGWGVRRGTEKMVRFSMFRIRNVRNGGLESALRGMDQGRVDFGVLQETKITNRVYMQETSGFRVMVTEVPSDHCIGIIIFYREAELFTIE